MQGEHFNDYVQGILTFFNEGNDGIDPVECIGGDVNTDGTIDITDVIRTVNIITNSGAPASDLENCAADVNLDGSVNVLDVLVIVNIILDERISSRDRSNEEILKEVEFISYENYLEISSNGKIKGLQLLVESEDDLEFT